MLLTGHLMGGNMKINIAFNRLLVVTPLAVILLMSFYITGCSSVSSPKPENDQTTFNGKIGWISRNCFAVKNSNLSSGTDIVIVKLGETQETVMAKIVRKTDSGKECFPLVDYRRDVNLWNDQHFYLISSEEPVIVGIGIIQAKKDKILTAKGILDLNKDGLKDILNHCTTSEGIQYNIWEKEAYKSKLIWRGYFYLGYGTESDCPDTKPEYILSE